jgi:hypothetical protein
MHYKNECAVCRGKCYLPGQQQERPPQQAQFPQQAVRRDDLGGMGGHSSAGGFGGPARGSGFAGGGGGFGFGM